MTIFKKIIDKQIPAKIVFEDDLCLAFYDVQPQAPTHVLLIPKKEIPSLADVKKEDQALMGHLMVVASQLARQLGIADKGFRIVTNSGKWGGQTVDHLHFHILGGRGMQWPPG